MVGLWGRIISWLRYAPVSTMPEVVVRTLLPAVPYVIDSLIPQKRLEGEVVVIGLQAKR